MGAPVISGASSLDRLKALDALPDLDSQFQEAKQLCDHRARAEMILKWLMAKLKTSNEARQNDSSWNLLASTVRLVPAQRLATLSSGLLLAFQHTWAAPDLTNETIIAIARLFNILLELGRGPDGTAIRSMLSMKGDTAAMMCGDWYRHVHQKISKEGKVTMLVNEGLLEPALQFWELRKRTDDDDTSFNNYCLAPILLLLAQLRNAHSSTSAKRKRGHDIAVPVPVRSYEHALETLMARHTVLPARTLFNRKHEPQPRRMPPGQQKSVQPTIKERLSALKELIAGGKFEDSIVDCLWLLLDVAMRSVSTPTPRQRFAERPWIETLFTALGDCVASRSRPVINSTLIGLLETIRRNGAGHTALATQSLTVLLKRHAIGEPVSKEVVDWQLIAKIVELDSDVLTNTALNEDVFDAISDSKDPQNSAMTALLREGIIVPTMKAYARGRSLPSFVDIWHKQLIRPRVAKGPSVWASLSAPFADILEELMLADQIITQIDRFSSPINAAVNDQSNLSDEEVASPLIANIVLLEALLNGTRSDNLVASIQDKLDALLHTSLELANLKGFKSRIATSCQYWNSCTRAFQLWFPFWANKQEEVASVEREGVEMITSKALKYALAQCSSSESDPLLSRAARAFVASLCACFRQFGDENGCAEHYGKALEHVVKHEVGAASVLARRKVLLSSLNLDARKEILHSPLLLQTDTESESLGSLTPIEAILSASSGVGSHQVNEEVVSGMIERLQNGKTGDDEYAIISTLANMDPHSVDQAQRITILDAVAQLEGIPATENGAARVQARLALILKLSTLPCQGAQLLTDPTKFWGVAGLLEPRAQGKVSDDSPSQLDSLGNVQLLEASVRGVLKSLLASQDSKKSQKALVEISQLIKDAIKRGVKSSNLCAHNGHLAFIKVAMSMLEASAKEDLKSRLVHRASKLAKSYIDTLMAECSKHSGETGARLGTNEGQSITSALQALLDVPDSFLKLSGIHEPDHAKGLYKLARKFMLPARVPNDCFVQSKLLAVCFQLICKHAPGKKNLMTVAEDILGRDLQVTDRKLVLLGCEEAFKQADIEWKLTAITTLTKEDAVQQQSTLLLQTSVVEALTKEDSEAMPSAKDILVQTLRAATSPATPLSARRAALQTLALICKDKSFLTTQYTIEQTLAGLKDLLSSSQDIGALYLDICKVLTIILAHHRSRLQGRFHLVVGLLQQLIAHLFRDENPDVHGARALAKLLESFCNPPALRYRKGGKPSELVDEAKKARAHAGQFAQHLLHFYCSCVFTGSLGEGIREALLPGLYAVIQAMEAYNEEGIKVLSSAATNSERAVLRSVYDDWKRFGKWEGV